MSDKQVTRASSSSYNSYNLNTVFSPVLASILAARRRGDLKTPDPDLLLVPRIRSDHLNHGARGQ